MKIHKTIGSIALAAGLLSSVTIAAAASSSGEIEIRVAPPPDRFELVPEPRDGYLFERGHYVWDGDKYVWTQGRFIQNREGHVYTPYALEHRGEAWYFRRGHWDDEG